MLFLRGPARGYVSKPTHLTFLQSTQTRTNNKQTMHKQYINNAQKPHRNRTRNVPKTSLPPPQKKIADRDVPARYLLRLGMGERDLDVEDDFSRWGG